MHISASPIKTLLRHAAPRARGVDSIKDVIIVGHPDHLPAGIARMDIMYGLDWLGMGQDDSR